MTEAGPKRRRMPAWVPYTVLRVLLFIVPFVVVYGLGGNPYIAAIVATLVGFCLSLLLLQRQRMAVARSLAEYRHGGRTPAMGADESAEDSVFDDEGDAPAPAGEAGQGSANTSARPTP